MAVSFKARELTRDRIYGAVPDAEMELEKRAVGGKIFHQGSKGLRLLCVDEVLSTYMWRQLCTVYDGTKSTQYNG